MCHPPHLLVQRQHDLVVCPSPLLQREAINVWAGAEARRKARILFVARGDGAARRVERSGQVRRLHVFTWLR
jgi:hypothetical protein